MISVASLVAGIFGKGGGDELDLGQGAAAGQGRFGNKAGKKVWQDFLSSDDPEAPTTVHGKRFPYRTVPKHAKRQGGPEPEEPEAGRRPGRPRAAAARRPPDSKFPDVADLLEPLKETDAASNALLVSAKRIEERASAGRLRSPDLLLQPADLHGAGRPRSRRPDRAPIDARGGAFPGTNLYVQIGHGRDYAWSATSAGQDIVDTFAVKLCEPGGGKPTLQSDELRRSTAPARRSRR